MRHHTIRRTLRGVEEYIKIDNFSRRFTYPDVGGYIFLVEMSLENLIVGEDVSLPKEENT
jgi:hypothetical protein